MRIGILSTMFGVPWGGSEELWAALAQVALENNIAVSICLSERPRPNLERFDALEDAGAEVFCRSDNRLYVRARQLARLAKVVHSGLGGFLRDHLSPLQAFFATRPDVLLITDGANIPSIGTIQAVQKHHSPRPYVLLSHNSIGEIPETKHRRQVKEFYASAGSALFVSESNLRATERQLTQRLSNARVVKNPVNLNCIDPVAWPTHKSPSFASVGRLNIHDKGQDILLEALSDPKWKQRDWHLCIFGCGDHYNYLKELATFYGLDDRVTFRGQCSDIRSVWTRHHALLLPSRVEGTPLAMVEAMLCARPVIGTAIAGIPEWVCDENGFLADAPTASCFAATLEAAWQKRDQWREMGVKARERAVGMYDPAPGDTLLSILVEAAGNHVHAS